MSRILALDPGETTGWVLYEYDTDGARRDRLIDYGEIRAAAVEGGGKASEGTVLTKTRNGLMVLLALYTTEDLAVVAIEAPAYSRSYNRFADEIRGVCKEAVAAAGQRWLLVPSSAARVAILGRRLKSAKGEEPPSPPLKGRAAKEAVKEAVEKRFGVNGLTYHTADAAACAVAAAQDWEKNYAIL